MSYNLQVEFENTTLISVTNIPSSASSYIITSLTPSTEYLISMQSVNLVGVSDWTSQISAYAGVAPTRPGLITFTASTRNTLSLSWLALVGSDTGGTSTSPIAITSYNLYMDNGYNGDFSLVVSQTTTTYTVTYLTPGLLYRFYL
jgi:hypothetical protein